MTQRNHLYFKLHHILNKKCYKYMKLSQLWHTLYLQEKNHDVLNSHEEKEVQYTSQQQ